MAEGIVIGNLQIPIAKGQKGDTGEAGKIISISLVMLSPTATPYATNTGTQTDAVIELGVPRGLAVSTVNINASGELVFTFNDGTSSNVGQVVGKGISEVTVTEDFDFVVTYTDGTSVTACNLEDEVLGTINDILESYYTKTEIDNKGFITKEVNNLTNYTLKTSTGSSIELSINSSTYVMTLNLKNSAGTVISTGTVDLPLETMVVGATYDNTNKKIVLTLKNGSTIDVPVGDLVSGLQSEITSNNKLSSDLVDDTSHTNKFVTSSNKSTWNAKYDKPSGGIPKTDLASDVQTSLGKADTALQAHQDISGKEDSSNKVTSIDENSTNTQYPSAKLVYDELVERDEEINQLWNDHPDITDTGTDITLQGTGDLKMKVDVGGNSTQETTSTSEGDEYDSPSPEHKQDINNVEGNVVVKSETENLLDITSLVQGYYNNDTNRTLTGTSDSRYRTFKKFLTAGTYTIICSSAMYSVRTFPDYDNSKNNYWDFFSSSSKTIIITQDTTIYWGIRKSDGNNWDDTVDKIWIVKGSTVTNYVEHKENTVTFPLSQGQKLMLGDTLEDDGIHHKRAQVVLDGTNGVYNTNNNWFYIALSSLNISIKSLDILSNYFSKVTLNEFTSNTLKEGICFNNSNVANVTHILIRKTDLTSSTEYKAWLTNLYTNNTPVILEYELETETTETYTSAQQTAYNKLKEMQSYYDLTHVVGSSDNAQPILTVQAKKSIKEITGTDLSNYQTKITSTNKLNSDLVDDTNQTNKFVTTSEKNTWDAKQNTTDNNLATTNKNITSAINEVNSIAKGANQALSYASYSAMITAFSSASSTDYNVGQNIYIETLEVPDLWVYKVESTSSSYTYTTDSAFTTALETNGYVQVGYYKLSALETQKVDLTNYVEFTDYASSSTAGVVKISILTQSQYDALQEKDTNTYYYIVEE